jgi:S1-C subfamily serine protease
LTVVRDQAEKKITVELVRSPRVQRELKKYRNDDFEFTARDIGFFDTASEQWSSDQSGVLVEEVKPGSWAELGSMGVGDLILEVGGQTVGSVEELRRRMEQVSTARLAVVQMKVLRGIHTSFLEIEPAWEN